jgi:hypothetical protein
LSYRLILNIGLWFVIKLSSKSHQKIISQSKQKRFPFLSFPKVQLLQFGFVNFWQKDFAAKAAYKMLVKLTPGGRNCQLISPRCLHF